ncbi:MAG TPA: RNA polymerase sigma factor [Pirellulales bacterium]
MSEPTEQSNLARSLEGDGEAYARIVASYQTQIARRMRVFANDPAVVEELVQEVFVDAYFSLPKFREGNFPGWLKQIATRVGYRYWKKNRRRAESGRDDEWWRQLAQHKIEVLDRAAVVRLVRALMDRLPPRDRLALVLIYIEGHSIDEAARLAGWSKTMVKVQAFRARRKMRAFFAELGIDNVQSACETVGDAIHERL